MQRVLIIGCGYAGKRIARLLRETGRAVTGVVRDPAGTATVAEWGAVPEVLDLGHLDTPAVRARTLALVRAHDAVVYAAGPNREGETERFTDATPGFLSVLREAGHPMPFVYLSSTGVYGNRGGAWVDEDTPPGDDIGPRGRVRVATEAAILAARSGWGLPACILRVSGIYGPGRHVGLRIRAGAYRVIEADPPLVTNRIHVDDLAGVAVAALSAPSPLYVVADGVPATLREVADFAASRLGLPPPPGEPMAAARERLGEANFHLVADSKRCRNARMVRELGVHLAYPDYRAGLSHLIQTGQ